MAAEMHSQQSDSRAISTSGFSLHETPETSLGSLRPRAAVQGPEDLLSYRLLKRGLDLLLILLASPFLLPVIALIAIAVRLSSPGPIFFSHRRIRRHGEFFSMWKFRTMCVNSTEVLEAYLEAHPEARAEWHKTHKLQNDPRVTRVGTFLRRTSLDELPQFWNVLCGSMSLVGPRPIVAAEVEKYGEYFADYCKVKPGVTGLWQVSGRSRTTYPERVQLDRKYANNWSLTGDLVILFRTLASVMNQDGAY
jgi:Undecaprenyl-phosphate galactose phosphotransferase WbaP